MQAMSSSKNVNGRSNRQGPTKIPGKMTIKASKRKRPLFAVNNMMIRTNSSLQWSFMILCGISVVMWISLHRSLVIAVNDSLGGSQSTKHTSTRTFLQRARTVQILNNATLNQVQQSLSTAEKVQHNRTVPKLGDDVNYAYIDPRGLPEGCVPLADWQTTLHPSCFLIHEMDLSHAQLVNRGVFRRVYRIQEYDGRNLALKTLGRDNNFDMISAEQHRKDAVAYEQLSASPYVANIYGSCVNSAVFDFAQGGDLRSLRKSGDLLKLSYLGRLELARDTAMAVADFHHPTKEGVATMLHGDIKDNQFILIDGKYRLNDFNRAHFVSWNPDTNQACKYKFGYSAGKWRSPEEYRNTHLTEKIDVWSLGVVLYCILTGKEPYYPMQSNEVSKVVQNGKRLVVKNEAILKSNHTFHKSMLKAMDMCLVHDKKKRASSRQVAEFLDSALRSAKSERVATVW